MKTASNWLFFGILTASISGLSAGDVYDLGHYFKIQPDKILEVKMGKENPLIKEVSLAGGGTLHTNGTIELPGGLKKQLAPGKEVTPDGLYKAADGRFFPIRDHYMIDGGKTTSIRDGQSQPVSGDVTLADGSKIMTTGWLVRPNGMRRRLLDGQRVTPDGQLLPAEDFVMNKGGTIVLQKDGALMTLDRVRTMAMSDGTRVSGEGQITRPDGTKLTLKKGERLNLAGAQ